MMVTQLSPDGVPNNKQHCGLRRLLLQLSPADGSQTAKRRDPRVLLSLLVKD